MRQKYTAVTYNCKKSYCCCQPLCVSKQLAALIPINFLMVVSYSRKVLITSASVVDVIKYLQLH
jgi:hypothetical protein